ncbi:MAG TPA: ribonuclease HII [Candidatus Thermoplasmatota archaeon]|nr:ribonuclease HII [Candidatus Thermoplasmatota archaeon]
MLAGVDEAGRGPVLGPLVVAAVLVESDRPLRKLGVKDSKLLTPAKREELAPRIRELAARVELRVVPAEELNARMPGQNLNEIEVDAFAELVERLAPKTAVLDACDVNAERFGRNVGARVTHPVVIKAMHEADARHPVVAAASILAKVERDRLMAQISATHGACGSGYSHDVNTQQWLAAYVRQHNKLPSFARREWETARRLMQRDLTQFLGAPAPPQADDRTAKPKKPVRRSRAQ